MVCLNVVEGDLTVFVGRIDIAVGILHRLNYVTFARSNGQSGIPTLVHQRVARHGAFAVGDGGRDVEGLLGHWVDHWFAIRIGLGVSILVGGLLSEVDLDIVVVDHVGAIHGAAIEGVCIGCHRILLQGLLFKRGFVREILWSLSSLYCRGLRQSLGLGVEAFLGRILFLNLGL